MSQEKKSKVLLLFESNPKRIFRTKEVIEEIDLSRSKILTELSNLLKIGQVKKARYGHYQYSGKSKSLAKVRPKNTTPATIPDTPMLPQRAHDIIENTQRLSEISIEINKIDEELEALKNHRMELVYQFDSTMDALKTSVFSDDKNNPSGFLTGTDGRRIGVSKSILDFLSDGSKRHVSEVKNAVGGEVRGALYYLKEKGLIKNVGRGIYQIA